MVKYVCLSAESNKKLAGQVGFLKALSDETRLRILCLLKGGEKCVCEIVGFLNLPQNLVSHHLKVLKDAGLVESRKSGLQVFYKSKDANVQKYINYLEKLLVNKK